MLYTNIMKSFKWLLSKKSNRIDNTLKKWDIPIDIFEKQNTDINNPRLYSLREVLESQEYNLTTTPLSFPVGKDEAGKFYIADFHNLPHIMAAGQTGSGKSSFTEGALIASLIYRNSPDDLKLILIDPKFVQFSQYNGIPHLLRPVINESKQAKEAVKWLVDEMDRRFDILTVSNTMNIDQYNTSGIGHMPHILLIIDEVSDLMMVDGNYYKKAFISLLQKSRATGIHLYIGTSSPREDVLPGLLRANFVTRIAFATTSAKDSKTLIDTSGAEKLLGRGDLLMSTLASPTPLHLQAPYVTEEEQARLVDYIIKHNV